MKWILAKNNVERIQQVAWSNLLVAFDFDGTLAPIVAARDNAQMRPETMRLLDSVAHLYPTIIISGRSRDDVMARLGDIPCRKVVGNHGMEPAEAMGQFEPIVQRIRALLEAKLNMLTGLDIEDKRLSLAIHYRRCRHKKQALEAILQAISTIAEPLRVVLGKLVVNVLPAQAPHKGDALRAIRDQDGYDTALYLGDDITDEDVFALDEPGRLLSIRIGHSRSSAAPFYLHNQAEIDILLRMLVDLRTRAEQK